MKLIGLTGGIATGKSTVSNYLSSVHHVPIVDADIIARDVVKRNEPGYFRVLSAFGPTVVDPTTGELDRPKLGSIVFGDAEARKKLNKATHPPIRMEMLRQLLLWFMKGERLCVLDTPLLFEAGLNKFVHDVVVVYCPEEVQKGRLISRDVLSAEQAQSRIESQMPIEKKREMADIVIDNSSDRTKTQQQVDSAISKLMPNRAWNWLIWALLIGPAAAVYGALTAYKYVETVRARWAANRATSEKSEKDL
ncbi:dephospho-CoA kinase [Spizellomyces punctatus DAOM BR117]|uniref:Dephospho-CoA kinase n=1 Tax=Spizellomyces punctatus (strain DAOM BR117) TaxID=645134 RepID=A0A0L0H6K0_SPIPD|nr:dephospho-CoA kinase [Spizellomyces punctatus DAOM BR117]KNC96589.1 dephospho-CoA kinase [Spizellomyces punctatus DAOM BR117]|eukprot:XP_016604629.1 dephospho-CoA kinase [Spizellomyces punctatus DAOM BR117]